MRRPTPTTLEWTLRIGAFMCFVGHGAFGVITKEAWVSYFAVVGIGREAAYAAMPLVGVVDITMGIVALVRPMPAVFAWMTLWAIWTALLRPLSGEPVWEALERAGNYAVPLALFLRGGWPRGRAWFARWRPRPLAPAEVVRLKWTLALGTLLLLGGHGALGVIGKHGLTVNYGALVPEATALMVTRPVGWFEIALACVAAAAVWPSVLVGVSAWKLVTEALFLA